MSKPISALTQFQNQTGPIPLSQLDANLASLWNASNDMATYSNYMIDSSGAPNSITVTPAAGLAFAYTAGIWIEVKVANTNTSTTVNINVNALGNQLVKNPDGTSPSVGQIVAGGIYAFQYDGTNFQIIGGAAGGFSGFANPTGSVGLIAVNGTATTAMRSDGSPALSQSIAPTWTGNHIFRTSSAAGTEGMKIDNSAGDARFGFYSAANEYGLIQSTTNAFNIAGVGVSTVLSFQVNSGTAISIGPGKNVTLNAPSTGIPLTVTAASAQVYATQFNAGSLTTDYGVSKWVGISTTGYAGVGNSAVSNSAFQNAMVVGTQTAHSLVFNTNDTARASINATGNLVVNSPASGVSATINGVSGTHSTKISDSATNLFDAGYLDIPQNLQTSSYQLVLSDRGKGVDFNGTTLTCTIPANASVAFPVGTTIVITNINSSSLSIAITTDTMTLAGTTTTGTRSLAQNGMATIRKLTSTGWLISGTGLT